MFDMSSHEKCQIYLAVNPQNPISYGGGCQCFNFNRKEEKTEEEEKNYSHYRNYPRDLLPVASLFPSNIF